MKKNRLLKVLLGLVLAFSVSACKKEANKNTATTGDSALILGEAEYLTAKKHEVGGDFEPDKDKAFALYKESAELGYIKSQVLVAEHYVDNNKLDKALYWYRKAAEQGNDKALTKVGLFYENGYSVEKDTEKALQIYTKASEKGFAEAQYRIGYLAFINHKVAEATVWFEKAAIQGHSNAQFILGNNYFTGIGIKEDKSKAIYWYEKAAEQGNAYAQYELAVCYQDGLSVFSSPLVRKDDGKARNLYQKAAEQGHAKAQFKIGGYCYVEGKSEDSLVWYKKSAEQGYAKAQLVLALKYSLRKEEALARIFHKKSRAIVIYH